MKQAENIDSYLEQFPVQVQITLNGLRKLIHEMAPGCTEAIKYGMPTIVLNGNLVHFAAYKNHIGFYPGSSGVANFLPRLAQYNTSKGTIQFEVDKPLPLDLIAEIVRFRVVENLTKKKKKK